MDRFLRLVPLIVAAGLLLAGGTIGCAQHRIPAIDPTGEHIFAGSTTLATHEGLVGGLFHKNDAPAAAVATAPPPAQPPCNPPVAVVPVVPMTPPPIVAVPSAPAIIAAPAAACPPQQFQSQTILPGRPAAGGPLCETDAAAYRGPELTITPARIVAPVNSEVIMAAGICAPDGYYVMRQPLEWMLAQDGVGQIVAVGHESPHGASFVLRNSPQKVATNYARAHTSTISQTLTRGTPSPLDDVYLHKGQSWITITSPTEGTSHVVVWAPKEHNWDRRKATATIYWVDAAWRFPQSVVGRGGTPQALTTVLTRASGEPISGWIVNYKVLDGPPASFGRGAAEIEARTDGAGRATAELFPASSEPGITAVRVQIIRPGTARGDLPQMVVGQGITSVQWTTPGLTVRALGTSTVMADGAISFRVEVNNSGDLLTPGVKLSYSPPPGMTLLNSTPTAEVFGQRLEWQLGDLPPSTTRVIELNCRAAIAGSIRSTFSALSANGLKPETTTVTDVRKNALAVKMTGPETVEVGREAKFLIDVTNTGDKPLADVTAADTFDPGLSHAGGESSPIVRSMNTPLAPGQSDRFAISFIVTQPGRQHHRLNVTAEGGHVATARGGVTGTPAAVTPPLLSVRVKGPSSREPGDVAHYEVEVKNNGSAPATNVTLAVTWGPHLELFEATRGHEDQLTRRTTSWRINQLAPGETAVRQLNCRCQQADDQGALVRATASSQQTPAVTQQTATVIAARQQAGTAVQPATNRRQPRRFLDD